MGIIMIPSTKLLNSRVTPALTLVISGVVLGIFTRSESFYAIDLSVTHFIQSIQPRWFVSINLLISLVEFIFVFIVVAIFVSLRKKQEKETAYLVLAVGLSWFLMRTLKNIFNIPCPTGGEAQELYTFHNLSNNLHQNNPSGFFTRRVCYPSGHVFNYVTLWGSLIFAREKIFSSMIFRGFVKRVGLFLISTVGISRITLGAHFLSDVIGGYLLGFAWLIILLQTYRRFSMQRLTETGGFLEKN